MNDAVLRAALLDAVRLDYGEVLAAGPETLPEPDFSSGYLRRRARLFKNPFGYARPRWQKGLRAAAIILLVLAIAAGVVWTNPTARAWVERYFRIYREEVGMDEYTFHGNGISTHDVSKIRPTYVPEGYVETEVFEAGGSQYVTYEKENGGWIEFSIRPLKQGGAFLLDTDHSTRSEITINGMEGQLYTALSSEWSNDLLLFDDEGGIFYHFESTEPPEVLIQMAESITTG